MTAQCVLAALLLMEANVRTIREFLAEYRATVTAKKSAGIPRAFSPGRLRTGGPSHRASNRRPIQTRRPAPRPAGVPDRPGSGRRQCQGGVDLDLVADLEGPEHGRIGPDTELGLGHRGKHCHQTAGAD